jgi:hypothetical protein
MKNLSYILKVYFVPTEERLSWPGGRTELPAAVLDANGFEGLEVTVPMGLKIGGLWEVILIGNLPTEFAKFVAILLVGREGGIALDEEAGAPSRAAIICARSW